MAYKGYAFRLAAGTRLEFSNTLKAFLVAQGWELHDTYNGVKASQTLTATNQPSDGQTMTLDAKVYTLKTNLTPTEGEIKIGADTKTTLDNIKAAVNRDDPGANDGVIYKIAAAHTTVEATTNTDTTQLFTYRSNGETGNACATTETLSNMSFGNTIMIGGVNDIQVYKSRGESGNEPYGYIWIDNNAASNYLDLRPYQQWNAAAHTGTRVSYNSGNAAHTRLTEFNVAYDCIVAGDKNLVYISTNANKNQVYTCAMAFGHIPRRVHSQLTTTTDSITNGTNVSVPVVSSAGFVAGQDVQILGQNYEGCDRTTIQSIPDETHIVVAAVVRTYASGAFLGHPASVFGYYLIQGSSFYPTSYINDAGTTVSASGFSMAAFLVSLTAMTYDRAQLVSPILFYIALYMNIGLTDDNCLFSNFAAAYDAGILNNDGTFPVSSTVTSATDNTITDSTKSWTNDELIGKFVVIVGSTGIGQCRKITDNDGTSLTVSPNWYTNPAGTSTYRICDKFYRAIYPLMIASPSAMILITDTATPS